MNRVDRILQQWRIRKAAPWIRDGARVVDVGCFDDSLFRHLTEGFESVAAQHGFTKVEIGARNTLYWKVFAPGAA